MALLLAGCTVWDRQAPIPQELTEAGVQARLRIAADSDVNLAIISGRLRNRSDPSEIPAPDINSKPESSAFSLADAIVFAQQHSPRLQSARAAIERSRGEEQAAFAPFLPSVTFGSQNGITSYNQGPGGPGPTGFLLPTIPPGKYIYSQQSLELIWTLYDFGWRSGRYNRAVALQQITELQLERADQTVQFDAAAAYLTILLAQASILTQEDAIRQAEATLKDSRAFLKGGWPRPTMCCVPRCTCPKAGMPTSELRKQSL